MRRLAAVPLIPRVALSALACLVLLGLPIRTACALSLVQVGLYDDFEISVVNSKTYANPFDFSLIELRAVFASPTGKSTSVFGFHDGDGNGGQTGSVWKLRFMPNEIGTWTYTYTWTDGTPGGSGSFETVASSNKGILTVDPSHPYSIMYPNGEHFFWNGDSEWFFLSDAFTTSQRSAAVDFLASKKVNNLLMVMVNDDTHDVIPWLSPSDKMHFHLQRLREWEAVIEQMRTNGIIADLWFYSDDSGSLLPGAGSLEEDTYFKYVIARFAAYSNVAWNLALEYDEYRSSSWVTARAQFVKDRDPFDHLLSVHRTDAAWPFAGNPHLDHTSLQSLGMTHPDLNSQVLAKRNETAAGGRAIPIMFEEFFIEGNAGSLDQFRKGIWAITLAGGFYKAASLGWWIGTPYQTAQHFDQARWLHDFMIGIPYWDMAPNNSIASGGYALVRPGVEYVVYLPSGGGVSIDLSAATGSLSLEWYNPRTGSYIPAPGVAGGGPTTVVAPDTSDWVLHIFGSATADSIPPSAPSNFRER